MKKKWLALGLMVLFTLLISSLSAFAAVGDIVDYTVPTDIQAYVNGYGIPSYNIKGFTAVAVEDLQFYGFETSWDDYNRTLNIYYDADKEIPIGTIVKNNSVPNPGAKAVPILSTDINTYINGYVVESFNINGKTIIFLGSLNVSNGLDSNLFWNPLLRTMSLEIYE
jgi:hypothetical protein